MFFTKLAIAASMALSALAVATPEMASSLQARSLSGTHSGDGALRQLTYDAHVANTLSPLSATFYATGLGACGITNTDSDYIAAVSHILYDSYPYVPAFVAHY